jgi:molybdenum cofactor cytidylyltransferase
MGRTKQLLPWPAEEQGSSSSSSSLVAAAFDAVAPACCAMIVVVGHEADAVVAALGERRFKAVHVDADAEMLASVKAGLVAARAMHATADVLLQPADQPLVKRETIERLIGASAEQPARATMPEYGGRGGHPVVIPSELVPRILEFAAEGGLRQFWVENAANCLRIPVDDAGVVYDVDTPADYERGVAEP